MKKWISFIALFLGLASFTFAQKFCYVDSQYILENLPEYTSSQSRLKSQTESWQKEIQQKQENLAKLQAEFEAEKILLTAEQVKEQEKKLAEEVQAVKSLQDNSFVASLYVQKRLYRVSGEKERIVCCQASC